MIVIMSVRLSQLPKSISVAGLITAFIVGLTPYPVHEGTLTVAMVVVATLGLFLLALICCLPLELALDGRDPSNAN